MPTKDSSPAPRPEPTLPEAVTSSATWVVQQLDDMLRDAVDDLLDERSLSLRGYWLLESIGAAPAHSQRELCDLLGVDRSDMVRLVDVLEDAGLVERVRDTEDRRRQLIGPTPAGVRLRDAIRADIATAEARVFASAPAPMREALSFVLSANPPEDGQSLDDDPGRTGKAPKKSKKKRKNKKKGGKRQ